MAFDPRKAFRPFSFVRSSRRPAGLRRRPSLGFETLETRQMLAADLAEIVGTVRVDVQADGNPANDIAVPDAVVSLYRDNGNGVWDAGDAAVGSPVGTDLFGKYRFDNLTAGKYFVKLTLPPQLQALSGGGIKEINITAADADGTLGQTIDDFESHQVASATPPLPSSHQSTKLDNGVMGGERDLFVELTSGTDIYSSVSLVSGGGLLRLASDTTVSGNAKIVWDGVDGNAAGVNPIGLGGLNFTSFNGNTITGIYLAVGADHPNCVVKLRVYTDANHWSEYTTTVPETAGGAATKSVTFNFDDLPTSKAGGGADFANVGAVELTFVGVSAVDGQVSLVGLMGLTTKTADFTAYNKLSLGDRVWNDANHDGMLNAGEQGIGGVKLNLYNDVDNNNQYTPGVDALVGTTTTDPAGYYQFMDLLPGKYVVQVDASNFGVGKALDGMASSKGAAIDPDNNVDNDDNGTPLAGYGVVSQAITLATANNTVDFGFYGFDLVLDKSVEQTSVSPLDEVEYTVRVVNDGPSSALNVQFVDKLPSGVTFKSYTVDKGGVVLSHSGGQLTGSLGTMVAGEVIVIKIFADVKANATGILKNEAEVTAPDEVYTLNNRDEVTNPIKPKFDLVLDKSVQQTIVSPLETVVYTVKITNDGPSSASGVHFVDNLPPGVTYKSHTVDKGGVTLVHAGGQLSGGLGTMAAGDVIIVTITAQVKANATGILTNEAEVSAPGEEYTLNNRDEVENPVEPKIDLAVDKSDSKDPVKPNEIFKYIVKVTNNGPSEATGVTVVDTLPANVSYQGASRAPSSVAGDVVSFNLGTLASGATVTFEITVLVDAGFSGTLLNHVEVSANENETNYANNEDLEPTLVQPDPASLGGYVYVDKNNNGVYDANEIPIPNVLMTLTGNDMNGNAVTKTTTTKADGSYLFTNLLAGTYHVSQTQQPAGYKDGKDSVGENGDGIQDQADGMVMLDQNDLDDHDMDALVDIVLEGGFEAQDYNFGELAITVSKRDYIRPLTYR